MIRARLRHLPPAANDLPAMALRVIAGSAGGIPLACPKGDAVRPTMDQVRGAIFSSLGEFVLGARVLDLFAGTGGLGIEALSRGAMTATFVERDRRAVACIRANLEKTRLFSDAELIPLDVFSFLDRAAGRTFDLIFADPPYTTRDQSDDHGARLLSNAGLAAGLAQDGMFVLEKSPQHPLGALPTSWEMIRQKRYGTAEVIFLRRTLDTPLT